VSAPSAGPAGGGGGALINRKDSLAKPAPEIPEFKRHRTAQRVLALEWDFPVYKPMDEREENQGSRYGWSDEGRLDRESAVYEIAGDDKRPLLVMRECKWCKGTDDALLSTRLDNERTQLMSQWFHLVKLPPHVLETDHPFGALFDGKSPPHLFVSRWDGSGVVELPGDQSQTDLWDAMEQVLERDYAGDHERALRDTVRLLDRYDLLDQKEHRLRTKLGEEIEEDGPGSRKVKSIQKELDKIAAERERLDRDLAPARELTLKVPAAREG
jgi:hypothetical protein